MQRSTRPALAVAVVATGLFAGAGLAVSVLEVVLTGPAPLYAGYKQDSIAAFGALLPVLGLVCLVTALIALGPGRRDRTVAVAAGVAVLAVIGSIVITLAVHGPLNAEILAWDAAAPPPDWEQVRDRWSTGQTVRLALAAVAVLALAVPLARSAAVRA